MAAARQDGPVTAPEQDGGVGGPREPVAAAPQERPRRRMRGGPLVLAASLAAVALIGTGVAYVVAHPGDPDEGGAGARLTDEAAMACSTAIAEGTVTGVEPLRTEGRFRILLAVERSYKPRSGKPELTFTAEGAGTKKYFRTGVRMLVVVSRFPAEGPETFRQGDPVPDDRFQQAGDSLEWGRQWVGKALPGSVGMECRGE